PRTLAAHPLTDRWTHPSHALCVGGNLLPKIHGRTLLPTIHGRQQNSSVQQQRGTGSKDFISTDLCFLQCGRLSLQGAEPELNLICIASLSTCFEYKDRNQPSLIRSFKF